MKLNSTLPLITAILFITPNNVLSDEIYADVRIQEVPNWTMTKMQTFSGTVPSRAWVFEHDNEEVAVSAMVTEGIENGLKGQDLKALVKIYTEAFIAGWGGKTSGPETGTSAPFCGGEAGYKATATFGAKHFDYYGCFMMSPDRKRIATIVTWVDPNTPEAIAARRLMTYVQAISWN